MDARERLASEAGRCAYCGFCEQACPTLPLGSHRGYGPRGRVLLARLLAEDKIEPTRELVASLYTCTLCGACLIYCPAGIDVVNVVRLARMLAAEKLVGEG
ncbi:(Fe-S)-binding protein [Hyperthermus butylicus]|uniref:Fe-S oxidoreductase n=1 Tax=Hyperthermus butylicus (strain DSM 5456 / JCM 9403 / PLM1-5) TaxID=415426 RepID=A2BMS4_HYPBU|nr:(Fe-S)-binding protein [Hyperthermus butylicus]ABM81285.1 putative Fe-S oxidoreductase [Hyperthermus butylicus DSM 5456]